MLGQTVSAEKGRVVYNSTNMVEPYTKYTHTVHRVYSKNRAGTLANRVYKWYSTPPNHDNSSNNVQRCMLFTGKWLGIRVGVISSTQCDYTIMRIIIYGITIFNVKTMMWHLFAMLLCVCVSFAGIEHVKFSQMPVIVAVIEGN